MITRPALVAIVGLAVACVGPYGERPRSAERPAPPPAAEETPREPEPEDAADPAGATIVGHVTPDGRFHADTGSGAAEPARVERRTVVTGTVRAVPPTVSPADPPAEAPPVAALSASGYRVQVFAAREFSTAEDVARRLEGRLGGQAVYVERADPWYKVRVGDFATRKEAEPLRVRLAEMGYAGAFTVSTTIRAAR